MERNVLVLGSGSIASEVPGWVNKKRIATAALVDKPEVPAGYSEELFAENTAHISPFKDVQNIDIVILVATEATVENDKRIYEQLSKWNTKLIVIADSPLGFASVEIVVSETGTYSLEGVLQLFEEIKPGEVGRPPIILRFWKSAVVFACLVVAMWVYAYGNPGSRSLKFEFSKLPPEQGAEVGEGSDELGKVVLVISVTIPNSLEYEEEGSVDVYTKNTGDEELKNVKVILTSDHIVYTFTKTAGNGEGPGNSVLFNKVSGQGVRKEECAFTVEPAPRPPPSSGSDRDKPSVEFFKTAVQVRVDSRDFEIVGDPSDSVERRGVAVRGLVGTGAVWPPFVLMVLNVLTVLWNLSSKKPGP